MCTFSSQSQSTITLDSTTLTERELAIGLDVPWEISWGPDDMIWVTEKPGRVLRIDPTNGSTNTVLNIENQVRSGSESGLLGMAFHPEFNSSPKIFLVYTFGGPGSTFERMVSYDWNGSQLENEEVLIDNIKGASIHDGSRLLITKDQKILMTVGDAGDETSSQNKSLLNGKLLRINLDGSIPEDNPDPNSYVYSFGHRNSQGLAYGPNDQIYSSEHGQSNSDEFNIIEANRNYGWPNVEGRCNTNSEINFCNANNVKEPLIEWSPCVAVNGICFYDNDAIPEWKGKMLMAVLGGFARLPRLSVLSFNEDGSEVEKEDQYFDNYGRIRDVCVNPKSGAIYFATNGSFYPSSGPNRIIEYANLDFTSPNVDLDPNQFIKIFPNPIGVDRILNIEYSENFIGSPFEIYDFNGKIVSTGTLLTNKTQIDLTSYSNGSYYLKASNTLGSMSRTIILQ